VPSAIQRFEEAAVAAGLSLRIERFPQGTKTAADAARAIGCDIGQIVKSLVFMADDGPFLALTSGSNRADPFRLVELLGSTSVRRATAEEAREATGYAIGGTPPFGHSRHLTVFVDRDLLSYQVVWAAAGTPDSVFPIVPDELLRTTQGQVADFKDAR
jgi:prolyl-tRNA editing enzyme YbaK/EbsC (Cys-tRNA(Pro) deacylase)